MARTPGESLEIRREQNEDQPRAYLHSAVADTTAETDVGSADTYTHVLLDETELDCSQLLNRRR
jgi:hypothetical protein